MSGGTFKGYKLSVLMATRIPLYLNYDEGRIEPFQTGDTVDTSVATNVGGGGGSANVGEVELLFSEGPEMESSIAITGQTGILSTSKCMAWVQGATHADNDETSHLFAGISFRCVCGLPTAGVGFTIYVTSTIGLCNGTFKIKWQWI